MAISAARIPRAFDDLIKEKHAAFQLAQAATDPEELQVAMPMAYRLTYACGIPGVARYPVDEWGAAGRPALTAQDWCEICMAIAKKDMHNLHKNWEVAQDIKDQEVAKAAAKELERNEKLKQGIDDTDNDSDDSEDEDLARSWVKASKGRGALTINEHG